jgi:caffeoyl-CoA O-methyltransferase
VSLVQPEIEEYSVAKSEPTAALLQELVQTTCAKTGSRSEMLCGPLEGRFLKLMVQVIGAVRVLEIGMFTGYSALSMAEGLPADGELVTCELDETFISIAHSFFARSPHGKKIKIAEGPALDSLKKLNGPFDLAFIDADKVNYPNYYEAVLSLLRSGGVILIDNVLYEGHALKPNCNNSRAIAALNDRIASDERVDRVMLPIRDGVYLIRKR